VFAIDNGIGITAKDCLSYTILLNIKFVTSEATVFSANGWSKRFSGYDPNNPNYAPNGIINLTDFITISLIDNKFEIFDEVVSGNVSSGTRYFNL
jgi:hypothetical protein